MNPSIIKFPIWVNIARIFLNLIGEKHKFRIIVTSENYSELELFWGLVHFQKGEKKEFIIYGTERYLELITKLLTSQKLKILKVIEK